MKGKKRNVKLVGVLLLMLALLLPLQGAVGAQGQKSLYVNADLNANSPIQAFAILPAPSYLTYQATSNATHYGGAGLALDTDSETLFVTYESYGYVKIVDATTLSVPATYVTAPGASNLAGIVVDQERQKVYTVDRNTQKLYQYTWDAATSTLALDAQYTLPDIWAPGYHGAGAHGIALDEARDLLYVADVSNEVKVYNTADWSLNTKITVAAQPPMGVAVDEVQNILYSGNAYPGYGCTGELIKTDLDTNTETSFNIRTLNGGLATDCVVGLAVDLDTGLVYVTTGNQASGGSDRILVFDSDLTHLHSTVDIGNPTGVVVPRVAITYNPLNLTKDDGLADDACVSPSDSVTYDLCFDNTANTYAVNNVTVVDTLPTEMDFVSATDSGAYDSGNHEVTWNIGTLAAGATEQCVSVSVQVNASASPGTAITNQSNVDSDETGPAYAIEDTAVCVNQPPTADPNGPYIFPLEAGPFDGTGSSDPDGDPLTYDWDWGDSSSSPDAGATPYHTYGAAGIYDVCLTVTDPGALSDTACTYAVIYDPSAGFVTGGGWIDSPATAYKPDPSLGGKANFGFVSKYKKGAKTPEGNTEFQFHAAGLNFHSSSYEWLVVTGSDYAMFKGEGTINGEGSYKFMLWAGDDEPDTFRIKIWEEDEFGVETVIYDNGSDQPIAGGSIVIHTKK